MKKLILILSIFPVLGFAQTGNVTGVVKSGGEVLPFANVGIVGSKRGAASDVDGKFTIQYVAVGKQTIQVSAVGYKTYKQSVIINKDKTTTVTINTEKTAASLDEVVVTGITHATIIKKNPIPIVSVSKKMIDNSMEANVVDAISKEATGLTVLKTGPNVSKPFIRGLGYNNVLTLYDGLRQEGQQWGDEHGLEIDDYMVAKAEVVKGPASLMYGSDAIAGVVNLIPYVPTIKDSTVKVELLSEYQLNNHLFGNSVSIYQNKNDWLYLLRASNRIAGNYQNAADGYVYNTGFKTNNITAMIGKKYKSGAIRINATLYDNFQGIPDGSRDSLSRKFTKQILEADDDIKNRPLVNDKELKSYELSPLHQHIQHYRVYLKNKLNFRYGDFGLIIGAQKNIRREYNHPTKVKQAGLYVALNTYNYGLAYNSINFKGFTFSTGVNGMLQTNKNKDATDFPIPNYTSNSIGSYFLTHWENKKWNIYVGVRYDSRRVDVADFYTDTTANGLVKESNVVTANSYHQFTKFNSSYNGGSGNIGVTYQISNSFSLKANVGRGYRAPSINEIASNGLDPGAHIVYLGNKNFKSVLNLQEDFGLLFNNKLITSGVAVFNNVINNYIYLNKLLDDAGNPVVDAANNATYKYIQTKAQLYGGEVNLAIHPDNFMGLSFKTQASLTYGYNRAVEYKNKGVNGEYLTLVPPLKWYSEINKTIKDSLGRFNNIHANIGFAFSGQQNRYQLDTETLTKQYTLINIGFGFNVNVNNHSKVKVVLKVNNLLNTVWQSNMSRLKYFENYQASPAGYSGIYGMGRNVGVKLIWGF